MAIQFEDTVVDCLKILRPEFDFVFLFDHSQGHTRKKEGTLDVGNMSRTFGGVTFQIGCLLVVLPHEIVSGNWGA